MRFKKITKFIKVHRARNVPGFKLLTTSTEIIIVPDDGNGDQLRIKYK